MRYEALFFSPPRLFLPQGGLKRRKWGTSEKKMVHLPLYHSTRPGLFIGDTFLPWWCTCFVRIARSRCRAHVQVAVVAFTGGGGGTRLTCDFSCTLSLVTRCFGKKLRLWLKYTRYQSMLLFRRATYFGRNRKNLARHQC